MRFPFHIIGNGKRQIRHADACGHFAVHQQIVFAQAVTAGARFAETSVCTQSGGVSARPVRIRCEETDCVLALELAGMVEWVE